MMMMTTRCISCLMVVNINVRLTLSSLIEYVFCLVSPVFMFKVVSRSHRLRPICIDRDRKLFAFPKHPTPGKSNRTSVQKWTKEWNRMEWNVTINNVKYH